MFVEKDTSYVPLFLEVKFLVVIMCDCVCINEIYFVKIFVKFEQLMWGIVVFASHWILLSKYHDVKIVFLLDYLNLCEMIFDSVLQWSMIPFLMRKRGTLIYKS